MTNDEALLTQLQADIFELLSTKYKDIPLKWILVSALPSVTMFFGNCCIICAKEDLDRFIEANGITHIEEPTKKEMMN